MGLNNKDINIIPYLPSLSLARNWMRARLDGYDDTLSWIKGLQGAGNRLINPRILTRTLVAGARGQEPLLLSVPIEGGASGVKHGDPAFWRISLHGDWPRIHLGALEAAYSNTAYYPHLINQIRKIVSDVKEGDNFALFTRQLLETIYNFLDIETLIPALRNIIRENPERIRLLSEEKKPGTDADLSILDVIFKRGPETIFTLL